MGRPPVGKTVMTAAERQRRHRAKLAKDASKLDARVRAKLRRELIAKRGLDPQAPDFGEKLRAAVENYRREDRLLFYLGLDHRDLKFIRRRNERWYGRDYWLDPDR